MSIKFRCSECEHGIKAPDAAAGKGVKCPKCGKKLRVPSGVKKKRAKKKPEPSSGDSAEFLANLDMDKIAHDDVELCQKCAAQLPEDETACPECGFDTEHLTTKGRKRKKMADQGIDPATYYEKIWKEPFAFTMAHTGLVFKSGALLAFFFLLAVLCAYFVIWVATIPPFSFWILVTVVSLLIPLGWLLTVQKEIINLTLDKKDAIKKIRFDFALCGMNGVKFLAWLIIYGLPFWILFGGLGVLLDYSGVPNGLVIGGILALIPIILLTPQAMSHLAMPVEQPGWFLHKIAPTLPLSFMPGVVWALLLFVVSLPVFGAAATVYFVGGEKLTTFAETRWKEGEIHTALIMLDVAEDSAVPDYAEELKEKYTDLSKEEAPEQDWTSIILPICLGIVGCFFLAFASFVVARANGLFTLNLKKGLNLIGSQKERKYVAKILDEKVRTRRTTIPAPLLRRVGAFITDNFILGLILTFITFITLYIADTFGVQVDSASLRDPESILVKILGVLDLVLFLFFGFYFASGESGFDQATPGKKAVNLFVCDDEVRPISTSQGWARFVAFYFLSFLLTLGIGFLIALFRSDKKTLHDLMSGTQVRMDKPKKQKQKKEEDEK